MVTRRGTRYSRPTPAPKCAHCASTGHVATSCPRTSYNAPSLLSLKCSSCVLVARSGYSDEPLTHQIILTIDPCLAHASSTSRPSRPTSSLSRRPRLNLPGIPPPAPRLSSAQLDHQREISFHSPRRKRHLSIALLQKKVHCRSSTRGQTIPRELVPAAT